MGFLLSVLGFIKDVVVAGNKIRKGVNFAINYKKIIARAISKYVITGFIILIFFGGIVYSITYAVKDSMDFLFKKYQTTDINKLYDDLGNMTEEEKQEFQNTIAYLDPLKIRKYIDKQRQSVPAAINGTKTVIEDGSETKEQVSVDVSNLSNKYVVPWQVIGSMDIITFNGLDINNNTILDASNLAMAQFKWAEDVTRDDTHYWKEWTVTTRDGETTSDGESNAKEHYKTTKTPLGLAESVNTMFGLYKYDIKRDVLVLDEPWSSRQLISKESHTEEHHYDSDGDGVDDSTESVTYTTYHYRKTRNKLVEDQALGPTFTYNPIKFLQFLKASKYVIKDLPLLRLTLESLPSTNNILDMIDRIINGNYGDLEMTGDYGSIGGISGNTVIPLFHQWDERWGNIPYGDHGTIATSACGPTSAAMILTGLQGDLSGIDKNGDGVADPAETAAYSVEHGYRVSEGTSWGYFADIGQAAGLNVRQYSVSDYQQVYEEIKNGHPVIASMGPGHFTSAGHFIVLASVLPDGKIKVNDPNRQECSDTPWDFESIIVPEALQFWAFDNPNRKVTAFSATGYTGAPEEGGTVGADGTDLLGKDLRDKFIAVDPKLIPLGSIVYIEVPPSVRYQTMPDGVVVDMNGYYKAVDTGNAIQGNIIDIYFGTGPAYKDLCNNSWGRQNVSIYIK